MKNSRFAFFVFFAFVISSFVLLSCRLNPVKSRANIPETEGFINTHSFQVICVIPLSQENIRDIHASDRGKFHSMRTEHLSICDQRMLRSLYLFRLQHDRFLYSKVHGIARNSNGKTLEENIPSAEVESGRFVHYLPGRIIQEKWDADSIRYLYAVYGNNLRNQIEREEIFTNNKNGNEK